MIEVLAAVEQLPAPQTNNEIIAIASAISGIAALLLKSGVDYLKAKSDARKLKKESDRSAGESLNSRAVTMVDTQAGMLESVVRRLGEMETKYDILTEKFESLMSDHRVALDHVDDLRRLWPEDRISSRPDLPERLKKA